MHVGFKILIRTAVFGLWASTEYMFGDLLIQYISPKKLIVIDPENEPSLKDTQIISELFGRNSDLSKFVKSDIRILGLVAGKAQGSILIAFRNGPPQVLKLGERSDEGLCFLGFEKNKAKFELFGETIEISHNIVREEVEKNLEKSVSKSI